MRAARESPFVNVYARAGAGEGVGKGVNIIIVMLNFSSFRRNIGRCGAGSAIGSVCLPQLVSSREREGRFGAR